MKVKLVGNFYKLVNFAIGKNSVFLITVFLLAVYLHSDVICHLISFKRLFTIFVFSSYETSYQNCSKNEYASLGLTVSSESNCWFVTQ